MPITNRTFLIQALTIDVMRGLLVHAATQAEQAETTEDAQATLAVLRWLANATAEQAEAGAEAIVEDPAERIKELQTQLPVYATQCRAIQREAETAFDLLNQTPSETQH